MSYEFWLGFAVCFAIVFFMPIWKAAFSATRWAFSDSWRISRVAKLTPNATLEFGWLTKYFFKKWARTFSEHLSGLVRVS
jgi:hypothetical protein